MDDFGSSLERDYGLGGRKGSRTGSRNRSNNSNNNNNNNNNSGSGGGRYLRFSESFGRNKLKHEPSSSYKGGWTSNSSGGGGGGGGGYGGRKEFPSTYSVYDEIFSSNLHSTIPVFEDVFRVASARMKVSELRDNDVFRGMGLRRSSSRVTYEDIFGDAPDEFSGPFLFSDAAAPGSRLTASSSSGGQSPATAQHASKPRKDAPGGSESPIPRKDGPGGSRTHSQTPSPRKIVGTRSESPTPRKIAPGSGTRSESPTPRKDAPVDVDFEAPNTHKEYVPEGSATRSESSTPRKDVVAEDLPDASAAQRPPEMRNGHHHTPLNQPENIQGSFLGALKNPIVEENGGAPNVEARSDSLRSRGGEDVLEADANGDAHAHTSPVLVENAWLSVTEVSLMTQPSENPPPARSAPGRASSSSKNSTDGLVFETVQVYSGPPPSRVPPPPVTSDEPVKTAEASSMPSELLARALKERSAHAEMTIREKVLDWQKHNLAHEEAEEEKQELESVKSRTDSFHKLEPERDEVERVSAEVDLAAAEQRKVSTEGAVPEQTERDAGAASLKQELPEDGRKEESAEAEILVTRHETEVTEKLAEVRESEARTTQEDDTAEDGKQDVEVGSTDVERVTGTNGPECEAFPSSPDGERHEEGTQANEGETAASTTLPQLQTITVPRTSTDTESTIGIDTISSTSEESTVETTPGSGTAAKEGPAPETPDRVEPAHLRKSEIEADVQKKKVPAGVTTRTESQQLEEEQRQRERTLVARITAEVKERAALDVKAKVERAAVERRNRRTRPRLTEHEALAKELEDTKAGSSGREGARVSLREQLEKERQARLANERNTQVPSRKEVHTTKVAEQPVADTEAPRNEARLRAERSLAERLNDDLRQRVARAEHEAKAEKLRLERARVERERLEKGRVEKERLERERLEREKLEKERSEKERLERIHKARERERERLEKLARERELEQQRLERELELEREIERKKDRVGLENRLEAEAEAARVKMERIAVERMTAQVRARAYERAAAAAATASRPSSVPKQRFGNSASMPSNIGAGAGAGAGYGTSNGSGMRRATSSTNLNSDPYSPSGSQEFQQEFQELKGETPERRKARLERFQRTQNRAAQALAQKNKRDLEMQSEQAERQRLSERLDAEIRRWSVGKDGNIRALLSTLQYVLWPESGWKQVSLTELINPAAVKKAYRRATLCVHPDKMQQKHATVQQKYIAEKVFHILQVAWNKFNSQEAL